MIPSQLTSTLRGLFALLLSLALINSSTWGQESYYSADPEELDLKNLSPNEEEQSGGDFWFGFQVHRQARVVLETPGEAFLIDVQSERNRWGGNSRTDLVLEIRSPKGVVPAGHIYFPRNDRRGFDRFYFQIPESISAKTSPADFLHAKATYFSRLSQHGLAGSAWFRYQAEIAWDAYEAIPGFSSHEDAADGTRARFLNRLSDNPETYDLLTGGRALAENLRLDRELDLGNPGNATVPIVNIPGIEVEEIDWAPFLEGLSPALDPLAAWIPQDQHAVFFPSLADLNRVLHEANHIGASALGLMDSGNQDTLIRERYERQLCFPIEQAANVIPTEAIRSIALTGSDSYLRTGSDVAFLFDCADPDLVRTFFHNQQKQSGRDATQRSIVSRQGDIIIVSNSQAQVHRLFEATAGTLPSLEQSPEYLYYRNRYPLGAEEESAFLILTDATIRRWGSPRWRIGAARRTQAAARMADAIAKNEATGVWDVQLGNAYGSWEFLTPILELSDLDMVTPQEQNAYTRFRNSYQGDWREYFDPIAARFTANENRVGIDISIMPLVASTDYRELIDLTRGVTLAPDSGDPHDSALGHWVMAMNPDSETFRMINGFAVSMAPGIGMDPLAWLGTSLSLYAEEDLFWEELAAAKDSEAYLQDHYMNLPVALRLDVKNPLGLAAFLAGLKTMLEQVAPQMLMWETKTAGENSYVRIAPTESYLASEGADSFLEDFSIYYAALPGNLVFSLNENTILSAVERHRKQSAQEPIAGADQAWLGQSVALRLEAPLFQNPVVWQANGLDVSSWNNLPILNVWKSRYPDRDPVQVHENMWGVRLRCPGGGQYRWNEEWQTMESDVYGHPGQPLPGSTVPPALRTIERVAMGLTFEENGLRAQAQFEKAD